ncbi:hypothetical protein ZIOFF_032813 [Zingiber officinale]|uniref:Deoxyuridine 5'-triphosphate nucleotidohydrolase n=1 Tax=Zingiber officinale TaxID=94328 RepID=A0A8J5GP88_ZINOF|nr:hypothetical protein ZIOFF_032813 [Zingiber officinale]
MTACPSCAKYYLSRNIQYKEKPIIPPYQKQEEVICELIDYTQHLQTSLIKQKGKSIIINTDDEDSESEFLPFSERKEKKVTFEPLPPEFLKIQRITPTTKIPERRSSGAAEYDLFIDQSIEIPAKERSLVKTGIRMEFPKGYYARITARSGVALKRKIDIGAGVIDSDYRGESIAQFILEAIITPSIKEVDELSETIRAEGLASKLFKLLDTSKLAFKFLKACLPTFEKLLKTSSQR